MQLFLNKEEYKKHNRQQKMQSKKGQMKLLMRYHHSKQIKTSRDKANNQMHKTKNKVISTCVAMKTLKLIFL